MQNVLASNDGLEPNLCRDKSELSDLISSTDMDDLIRLCTSLGACPPVP